jgi:hypothetical protein
MTERVADDVKRRSSTKHLGGGSMPKQVRGAASSSQPGPAKEPAYDGTER